MPDPNQTYASFLTELREISLLGSVGSVLGWDERVNLPVKGTEHRGSQMALLSRMVHERFTSPRIGEMLAAIEGSDLVKDADSDAAVDVRETRRSYNRATKLPSSPVEERPRTEILAKAAWVEAGKKSNYAEFEPWLAKWLTLKLKECDCVGYKTSRYDALLDPFEPDETAAGVAKVFESLRDPLVDLIGRITSSGRKAPLEILERKYSAAAQEKLGREAATQIGFDFSSGRLDVSVHPFCSGIGP